MPNEPRHRIPRLHRPAARPHACSRTTRTCASPRWSSRGCSSAARSAAAAIDGERIELIAGDIAEPRLGLGDDEYERLPARCDRVFHLAAIYYLAVPLETRAAGQRRRHRQRPRVLPRRRGARAPRLHQHRLRRRRRGRASSTSTSWRWARSSRTTTSRPSSRRRSGCASSWTRSRRRSCARRSSSATRGPARRRSSTGRTSSCGRSHRRRGRGARSRSFGRAEAPFNVVPVDFVVEAIAATAGSDERVRRDPSFGRPGSAHLRASWSRGSRSSTRASRLRAGSRRGLSRPRCASSPCATVSAGTPRESIVYLNHPVRFDTRRAVDRALSRTACARPASASTPGRWSSFFREHEDEDELVPGYARG